MSNLSSCKLVLLYIRPFGHIRSSCWHPSTRRCRPRLINVILLFTWFSARFWDSGAVFACPRILWLYFSTWNLWNSGHFFSKLTNIKLLFSIPFPSRRIEIEWAYGRLLALILPSFAILMLHSIFLHLIIWFIWLFSKFEKSWRENISLFSPSISRKTQRYVKPDYRTEKMKLVAFRLSNRHQYCIDNTLQPKNVKNRNNRFSKTEKIKSIAKMNFWLIGYR